MGQRRVGDQTRRLLPSRLAVLASLDELEGILSRCGVEHDVGKEGNRVEGGFGAIWASDELGTKQEGKSLLIWPRWRR